MKVRNTGVLQLRGIELMAHCYARYADRHWQAFCLDFDLAVPGETFAEMKDKLDAIIKDDVFDALVGEDQTFAHQLLSRRAPVLEWVKYYLYAVFSWLPRPGSPVFRFFDEPLPLTPILPEQV